MMTLEQMMSVILFFAVIVILLAWAFAIMVKHYGIVQQNEELREYVAFSETRRQRAMQYLLETVCKHDKEYIDYVTAKKLGLLAPPPERERPPLRIHQYEPIRPQPRIDPEPRPQTFRQPEPPEPRERVIIVTEPHREMRREPRRLSFWGNHDDEIIDVSPNEPSQPHRAMPQAPLLLGKPKNKGGRPRKHADNAARKRAFDQRQRGV